MDHDGPDWPEHQQLCQELGLLDGPGIPVENKAVPGIRLLDPFLH
jgi:hypothetical protein